MSKRIINDSNEEKARNIAKRKAASNPLRVVMLNCHGWVRDSDAIKNDWIWCEGCGDLARVIQVRE